MAELPRHMIGQQTALWTLVMSMLVPEKMVMGTSWLTGGGRL